MTDKIIRVDKKTMEKLRASLRKTPKPSRALIELMKRAK